jgi:hypothetical protein
MFTGDAAVVVVEESRNGLRDVGLGGGSWGERWVEEGIAGEAARFRKGLFDDRLMESEGDRLPSTKNKIPQGQSAGSCIPMIERERNTETLNVQT